MTNIPFDIVLEKHFPIEIINLILKFLIKDKPVLVLEYFDLLKSFSIHEKRLLIVDCLQIHEKTADIPFFNHVFNYHRELNTRYFLNIASIVKDLLSLENVLDVEKIYDFSGFNLPSQQFINLNFIKYLYFLNPNFHKNENFIFYSSGMYLSNISIDYSETVEWFISIDKDFYDDMCELAIWRGDLSTLKHLYALTNNRKLDKFLHEIAKHKNNLEIIEWLNENCEHNNQFIEQWEIDTFYLGI
jgi:hypothetical protein